MVASAFLRPIAQRGAKLLDLIYPPRCFACSEETDQPFGLCATCWSEASFISGTVCNSCGAPVPGDAEPYICESCAVFPPPWQAGRAAMLYDGSGKRIVLSFKHSDRTDMAGPLARWMLRAGAPVLEGCDMLVPVPMHWRRLFQRGYNQAALLAQRIGAEGGIPVRTELLRRSKATETQEGRNREARFENQNDTIEVQPRQAPHIARKVITIVDDVMTTGATLSACTRVLQTAGAAEVRVLMLARVARDGHSPIFRP